MAKPRKRHIQTEIVFKKWGGKRRGAGRPRRGPRRSVPHLRREDFSPNHPLHVTLRVLDDVGRLRRRDAFHAVRKAMLAVATRDDFRVVHLSDPGQPPPRGLRGGEPRGADQRDDRVQDVGRPQAEHRGRPLRPRVRRPLPRRGAAHAHAGAERDRVRLEQLAQARRGSRRVLSRRSVLDRNLFPRLERNRYPEGARDPAHRRRPPVPRASHLAPRAGWQRANRPISLYEVPGPH